MIRSFAVCILGAILLSENVSAASDVEFHRDVMPLVEAKCIVCHSRDGVSFSYEDPDEAYKLRMAITSAVAEERMPPWLAEAGHQVYVDDYSLTEDEKAVFAAWAAAGYPREIDTPLRPSHRDSIKFDADLTLPVLAGGSYLPNQDRKDDYRCFIVDWPYDSDKYVTAFRAEPGNLRVAHHLVGYAVGPEAAEILKAASAEEDGPGHQCFGGALPDRLGDEAERQKFEARFPGGWKRLVSNQFWLSHWAPGTFGQEFPEGTGILVRPGSVIVVQMHYYSAFAPGESDSGTQMHFKVADAVQKPSINVPVTDNRWLNASDNQSMSIPPGATEVYETSVSFERIVGWAARVLKLDAVAIVAAELQSANVHMHSFGASGTASLIGRDGHKETLLRIPQWDIDWQRDFFFTESKRIPRADFADTRLAVECTYSNYTDKVVYGGYGSNDEMCFNFSYVSLVQGDGEQTASSSR